MYGEILVQNSLVVPVDMGHRQGNSSGDHFPQHSAVVERAQEADGKLGPVIHQVLLRLRHAAGLEKGEAMSGAEDGQNNEAPYE